MSANQRHIFAIVYFLSALLAMFAPWQQLAAGESKASVTGKEKHVMCAAANAILGTRMESGAFADIIAREARRHADAARKEGATTKELEQAVKDIAGLYNQRKITWEEIGDIGEQCTGQ